ncbi:transposase, partial [uncultured Salegentibacter sp.]
TTLKDHLQDHIDSYDQTPESLTADAGYGSEENYTDLEEKEITAYVKYNYFHKEQRDKKHRENPFHPDNLFYNKETDTYYCPMGQAMKKVRSYESETTTGFKQQIHRYQAANCKGCPLRGSCHKAKGNRTLERNHNLIRLKEKARNLLLSEEGIAHRKRRCWDVEAVFGNIKQNMGFKRFMLRGMDKVTTEIGLIAMAHNLRKFSIA